MTIALIIVGCIIAYCVIAGVVHAVVVRSGPKHWNDADRQAFSGLWPITLTVVAVVFAVETISGVTSKTVTRCLDRYQEWRQRPREFPKDREGGAYRDRKL